MPHPVATHAPPIVMNARSILQRSWLMCWPFAPTVKATPPSVCACLLACSCAQDESGGTVLEGCAEAIAHVEGFMAAQGPYHAVMGFSQGAALASTLVAAQQAGTALQVRHGARFCCCASHCFNGTACLLCRVHTATEGAGCGWRGVPQESTCMKRAPWPFSCAPGCLCAGAGPVEVRSAHRRAPKPGRAVRPAVCARGALALSLAAPPR